MLRWRDPGAVPSNDSPPLKSGARAGGRRLSVGAEAVTVILSRHSTRAAVFS